MIGAILFPRVAGGRWYETLYARALFLAAALVIASQFLPEPPSLAPHDPLTCPHCNPPG